MFVESLVDSSGYRWQTVKTTGAAFLRVLPEFTCMNVYEHRFNALTWPGQGELWNKEHPEPPLFRLLSLAEASMKM